MTSFLRRIQSIQQRSPRRSWLFSRVATKTAIAGLAFSLSLFGNAKPSTAATTTLSFNNDPTLVSGTARTQGAVYSFANVAPGVDALVQVATIQNAQLKVIDDNSTFPGRFQPTIAPSATSLTNATSYVRFNFKLTPSSTPGGTSFAAAPAATATNVYFSAQDVDGNGAANTIREFVETIGATTSYVANPTLLQRMATLPVAGGIGYQQINSQNVQPGIGTDDRYEFYSFLGNSVSEFSVIGGNITGSTGCTLNNIGCDRQNSWTFNVADVQRLDFGDAPIGYGDAYHPVPPSPAVFLGASVEGDDGPNYTASADGDDVTGVDDEDGVASFPILLTNATSYSLNLTCVGTNAPVTGWIDFNKNGTFENTTEKTSGTCNGSTVTLNWTGLSGLSAGNTYARFRTASIASEVTNPTGQASNGEVEDYQVAISPPNSVSGTLFEDRNRDDLLTGGEPGLPAGAVIRLLDGNDPNIEIAAATVNASGQYNFPNVANGSYVVRVDAATVPAGYLLGSTNNNSITVASTSVVVDFPFDTINIAGTVFEDFDGNNIQNGSEFGLQSVTVSLFQDLNNDGNLDSSDDTNADGSIDSSDSVAITVTDFDGKYGFNVADGNYLVLVDSADSSLGNRPYGGVTNTPNNPLNNPRNADVSGASVATGLDFPYDVGSPPDICNGEAYTPLFFNNPALVEGSALALNAVYRFPNVTSGLDALVKITSFNNGAILTEIDGTGGEVSALQPSLDPSPNTDSSVDFEITFVAAGTTAQTAISSFSAAGLDIDGDGGLLREYIELTNFSAYRLETPTTLAASYTPPTGRFESTTTLTQPGISVAVKQAIAVGDFENVSQFRYRVGAIDSANSTTERLNSLFFGCVEFDNQNTTTTAYAISGTLYRDDDGSDSFNNGESTLPGGITIDLLDGSDVIATTITDSNGQYVFTSVPNGIYSVRVNTDDTNIPNGTLLGTPNDVSVTVADANSLPVNFGFDTVPVASDPNVLLVKRITAINGDRTQNPNDGTALNQFVDDTVSPQSDDDNDANWPSNYLLGAINGGNAKPVSNDPADTVEYTIYFLSAGNAEAKSVLLCDRIPTNTTFISDAFNSSLPASPGAGVRGLVLGFDGSEVALTNANDGDEIAETGGNNNGIGGYYFSAGTEPSTLFPNINCGGSNDNGAIVVDLSDIPNATGEGTPANSYGFIRFRVAID
ncbi:MAG: SdrD B-like domain-containing protein [Phormidesmis sp.]